MINSVNIPLIKNKCGDQTDINNYRPIALSSIISKVFDHIIAERLEVFLWTNDNQFCFKLGHSTDLCIYAILAMILCYWYQKPEMTVRWGLCISDSVKMTNV